MWCTELWSLKSKIVGYFLGTFYNNLKNAVSVYFIVKDKNIVLLINFAFAGFCTKVHTPDIIYMELTVFLI